MERKIQHIRHSAPVEEIMDTPPKRIIRWGISIIAFLFLMVLTGAWLIKFPDIIRGEALITTVIPPANLTAKVSGRIEDLFINNGDTVSEDMLLGVMESTASYERINWLDNLVHAIARHNQLDLPSGTTPEISFPEANDLGEIQQDYSRFRKNYLDYISHITIDSYGKQLNSLGEEIAETKLYIKRLEDKERLNRESLALEQSFYSRDSILHSETVLTDAELELSRQKYVQKKIEFKNVILEQTDKTIDLYSREQLYQNLSAKKQEEENRYFSLMTEAYGNLVSKLEWWKQTFMLRATFNGRVSFTKFWAENMQVAEGETVMTIVPEGQHKIIARINLPMSGSGKVHINDPVNIKLKGFPYLEFGFVQGTVSSKSPVPHNNMYVLEVELPLGMETNYGKSLSFTQNMEGRAEISTEDKSLLERIIYPLRYFFEKNRR